MEMNTEMTIHYHDIKKDEYLLVISFNDGWGQGEDETLRDLKEHTPRGKKGKWKRLINMNNNTSRYILNVKHHCNSDTIWRCYPGLLESGFGVALKLSLGEKNVIKIIKAKVDIPKGKWREGYKHLSDTIESVLKTPTISYSGYSDYFMYDSPYLDDVDKQKGWDAITVAKETTNHILDDIGKILLKNHEIAKHKLMNSLFDFDPTFDYERSF